MTITDWPTEERPREKLLAQGAHTLSDAELLAIFIRCGTKGKTALDIARDLLRRFGNVKKLLDLRQEEFCAGSVGLGVAKYAQLQAVIELSRRYLIGELSDSENINSTECAKLYCATCLSRYQQEVFIAVFLDSDHHLLSYAELFRGTIDRAAVYPREVVKQALQCNAAALIVAHNHLSGNVEPSEEDKAVTLQLQHALALVDIKLLDHIIVGKSICFSFAEKNLLAGEEKRETSFSR